METVGVISSEMQDSSFVPQKSTEAIQNIELIMLHSNVAVENGHKIQQHVFSVQLP